MSVYDHVRAFHDKRMAGCRGGSASEAGLGGTVNSGCFYGITSYMKQMGQVYPFVIFNGDGPEYPFEIVHDRKAQNAVLRERKVSWNEFVGTKRSQEWVRFLLSKKSPWWKLGMYLMTYEPEYINNAGFIFRLASGPQLPTKLLYNFCMAMRFCWDQPSEFAVWLKFVELKYDPAYALFLAMNFRPKTAEFEGPWEIMWPWNFLEDGGVECAYRFINGLPAVLDATGEHNPNVQSLWAVGKPDQAWVKAMSEKPMDIGEIMDKVEPLIKQQEERLKCVA